MYMVNAPASFNLQVSFIREGNQFVAYSPALDLSTAGDTLEEAKKNFAEAASIFFENIISSGNAEEVLSNLGWGKNNQEMIPPVVVSQEFQTIKVGA